MKNLEQCPKCKEKIGFCSESNSLWFNGNVARLGFGRKKGDFLSENFRCNSIGCDFKFKAWVKITIKPYSK